MAAILKSQKEFIQTFPLINLPINSFLTLMLTSIHLSSKWDGKMEWNLLEFILLERTRSIGRTIRCKLRA